jgi:predicted protein tyrosine phosphatase
MSNQGAPTPVAPSTYALHSMAVWTLVVLGAACTLATRRPPQPLATSLQELAPHADGDHFVYVWRQALGSGSVRAGVEVEHLTSLGNGEFDVTLSEDGVIVGRTRFRDDGHALLLLSESLGRSLRLSYDPPLPQLETPVYAGESRSTATAVVTTVAEGKQLDTLQVTQLVETTAAPTVRSALGDYTHGVKVRTVRTLQFPNGPVELSSTAVLVPGIGEIRSEGAATGAAPLVRELACATIGGRAIGNCQTLRQRVEELEHAGPTDVQ